MEEPGARLGETVRRWRTPLCVAALVAVVVLAALPISGRPGPALPGFSAVWCTIVLLSDVLSVVLLVGLYRNGRGLRMLVLAVAFAWSAIVVVALAFSLPTVTDAQPWLGQGRSTGWLYVSRHLGPPLLIAVALVRWPARWEQRAALRGRPARLAAAAVLAALGLGAASVVVDVAVPGALPRVVDVSTGHLHPAVYALMLAVNLAAVVLAFHGVASRADRAGVEVWTVVAAFAWLGDVAFVGMHGGGFSVAYYGSRLLALLAALIVPASILVDTWRVHQRLTAGTADLEARVDRLLEAHRIRDHVSAVVSHDLRAPLAGLYSYLEVLVDDEGLDPALARRMLERCLMLTRRLTLLSEDLLAATTSEHSELAIRPADLDLSQQLAECAGGFPDLDLRIECPRGVHLHADPLRLQQILSNLVRNAQVHGAEPVVVDVSADAHDATIRVADAGEGVPESFIPRLFERYAQGARVTSGAGIGLSVVHDLVLAQGGTIGYDLTDPAFIVTLPVCDTAEPPEGQSVSAPEHGHARI